MCPHILAFLPIGELGFMDLKALHARIGKLRRSTILGRLAPACSQHEQAAPADPVFAYPRACCAGWH
ncbi:hypothetical protein C7T35_32830 [Variovorax sp. WS11]|nr:hypothetical protein C7T35_32830 [Variovorax sp. WS11]